MVRFAAISARCCSFPAASGSNLYLMDSGYSINPLDGDPEGYAIEVHLIPDEAARQQREQRRIPPLCQRAAQVARHLPRGVAADACVKDGSCIQKSSRSLTVTGRCVPS
jgi:hypothetical protein